jgi:hypothetical protein
MFLLGPLGKRVGRGGYWREPIGIGHFHNRFTQQTKRFSGLAHVATDSGTNLDLRSKEFRGDLLISTPGSAIFQQRWGHRGHEIARFAIDQQILLFDPQCEGRLLHE